MRSREGKPRPCGWCQEPTLFLLQEYGEGRWLDCCVICGERPARRRALERKQVEVSKAKRVKRKAA